ncbi:hypothetical protein L208DRAFT_773837 [Tricholoma matsutake]|nr:hypothetical protein L208DRAFT_773837 [Tricholoma matsutake 945]
MISQLLATNKVPSNTEAQAIRESVAGVQLDITAKDAEIALAQVVLDRLIDERKALEEYKNEHAAFLTPARRLPPEILSEIFSHCLPTVAGERLLLLARTAREFMAFNPRNAPALLLRVCRDWTTIVLSSPRLWSLIDLQASTLHSELAGTLVQTWLSRSHQAPLLVILDTFFLTFDQMISSLQTPATRNVLEQSHRWRAASMTLWLGLMDMFLPLKNHLPELEELHLKLNDVRAVDLQLQYVDLFWDAPKLRLVSFYRVPSFPITNIKLPWAQLTHFSFEQESKGQSFTVFCTLLRLAPNLLEVGWVLEYDHPNDSMLSSVVQHSRLCNLSMSIIGDPGSSFDLLSLPSLRSLTIATAGRWSPSWSPFSLFISRNTLSLESFQLRSPDKGSELLIAFLTAMPSLTHLTMVISNLAVTIGTTVEELLQALHSATDENAGIDAMLLPRLRTIRIEFNSHNHKLIMDKFIDMVESRWRAGPSHFPPHPQLPGQSHASRIESASLLLRGGREVSTTDTTHRDRIEKLKVEGLAVQVSYSRDYNSLRLY